MNFYGSQKQNIEIKVHIDNKEESTERIFMTLFVDRGK